MAVQIILKHSSIEDKRPTASQMALGEIALNYNPAGAFLTCKDTDGNVQQVGGVKISTDAPDNPPMQCLWFKQDTLTLFVYDGAKWLPIAGAGGGGGSGIITTVIGDEGIEAFTDDEVVTLEVDIKTVDGGLKFESGKLAAEVATDSVLGSVKIGNGIDVTADGTISAVIDTYTVVNGGDGISTNVEANDSVTVDIDLAGADDGLEFRSKKLSASVATGSDLGSVIVGDHISVDTSGVITPDITSKSELGIVQIGDYISVNGNGLISPTLATTTNPGIVKIGSGINVDLSGEISVSMPPVLRFRGGVDLNSGPGGQLSPDPAEIGDTYAAMTDASSIAAGWTGIEGDAAVAGDLVAWNGTAWVRVMTGGTLSMVTGQNGIVVALNGPEAEIAVDLVGGDDGLEFEGGKLKASVATSSSLGVVKAGTGINITSDGTISAPKTVIDLDYKSNSNNAGTVTNTGGTDAEIPIATNSVAGLFTGEEKQKLAGIENGANAGLKAVNLDYTSAVDKGTVTNDKGNNAVIPLASGSNAGLFSPNEKSKLDGISDNANVGITGVSLGYTPAADKGTVTNDQGSDATIPLANNTNAGLFTAAEKSKLAGIEDGATVGGGITGVTGADGIKVNNGTEVAVDLAGQGLEIDSGKLKASIATTSTLGVVKAGTGIGIASDGTISATGKVTVDLDYTPEVSIGTITNTAGNSAVIPLADNTNAGLFSATEKSKLNNIEAGANVGITGVNLGYTPAVSGGTVTNDKGNNASIPDATNTNAGLFTGTEKQKLGGIEAGANVGLKAVNLGYTPATDKGTVTNSGGNNSVIPLADGTNAGLFTAEEKKKLAGIEEGATAGGGGLTSVNLGYTPATDKGTVTNSAGNDSVIPVATNTNAGLFTGTEKQKLGGIEAGANVGLKAVNLGYTPATDKGTVTNSGGNDSIIPVATNTNAGLFTGAEKQKLAGLDSTTAYDSKYVRKDAGTFAQTVQSSGNLTFKGNIVLSRGTTPLTIDNDGNDIILRSGRGSEYQRYYFRDKDDLIFATLNPNVGANSLLRLNRGTPDSGKSSNTKVMQLDFDMKNADLRGSSTNSFNAPAFMAISGKFNRTTSATSLIGYNVQSLLSDDPGMPSNIQDVKLYAAHKAGLGYTDGTTDISLANASVKGFYSNLTTDGQTAGASDVFANFHEGTAPNYFNGIIEAHQGIQFVTAPSSTIDTDLTIQGYEQGTFTPTISGSAVTYNTQFGGYTLCGNIAVVSFEIRFSNATGTNQIGITLPFSAGNYGSTASSSSSSLTFFNSTGPSVGSMLVGTLARNSNVLGLAYGLVRTQNQGSSAVKCSDLPEAQIRGTVTYTTNV